jgi:hypothetical protein
LNVKKFSGNVPNFPSHNALEEKMINTFIFKVEDVAHRFIQVSLKQIVFSHEFVMRQEPKEHMHSSVYDKLPNSRSNPTKINDSIKRTNGAVILPNQRIAII